MIETDIKKLNLPPLTVFNNGAKVETKEDWEKRREELKEILCREEYGYFPQKHLDISVQVTKENGRYCMGSCVYREYEFTLTDGEFSYSLPVKSCIPKEGKNIPVILSLNFDSYIPNSRLPVEEIYDLSGFAVFAVGYKDITSDDGDYTNGMSAYFYKENEERKFGKILVWAWTAMHIVDYITTLANIDKNRIAVSGHSRLGKTSLLLGAFDERIRYVYTNNSGQSGDSLSRGKTGETVDDICRRFPFWFCEKYNEHRNRENEMPFDQHFLTALVAPRCLYITGAEKDSWADPMSEYLCCAVSSEAWEFYGETGFVHPDRYPVTGEHFHDGNIGYHYREGCHYMGRYDWQRAVKFFMKH